MKKQTGARFVARKREELREDFIEVTDVKKSKLVQVSKTVVRRKK